MSLDKLTAEQRARIAAEVAEVMARVRGEDIPKRRAPRRVSSAARPKKPKYDRFRVLALHQEGLRVFEIAEAVGAHRATVARILNELGVSLEDRKGGPVRRDRCARGHSMEDATPVKGGGRACRKCKQDRDRAAWRAKRGKRTPART